jgi:hypothetical protein
VLAIAVDDALLIPRAPDYAVLGMLDEPAHLATSVILVGALAAVRTAVRRPLPTATAVAALIAGNLIDVDHVPGVLGTDVLTEGTPRPYSHSITTLLLLALLVLAGRTWPRRLRVGGARVAGLHVGEVRLDAVAAGAALGVTGHLLRDLATAPVALLWPFSPAGQTLPHPLYLAVLVAVAAAGSVLIRLNLRRPAADTAH